MTKLLILFSILMIFGSALMGAEYHVDTNAENEVKFISDAPLDDFEGITDKIDGYVYWEGDHFPPDAADLEGSELYFEVDLASLDTGIGLRNRHMRENYLETDQYPYAKYTAKINSVEPVSDSSYNITANGKFFIHGIEKDVKTVAEVIPRQDNRLQATASFEVKLSDYDIDIPKLMFMKLNEVIQLELDFNLFKYTEKN